jgi:hypothetical protein
MLDVAAPALARFRTRMPHCRSLQALLRRRACLCARALALWLSRTHRTPPIPQVGHLSALCPGLELVAADLLSDEGWDAACAGVTYVHHIASSFPLGARVVRRPLVVLDCVTPAHARTHALTPRRAQW